MLVVTLAGTLTEIEMQTLGETLVEVEAKALVDTLFETRQETLTQVFFFCNLITVYFSFLLYNNNINFYIHYRHYNFF